MMEEIILFGLSKRQEVIDEVVDTLEGSDEFNLKLVLTESLNNAFHHGNKGDAKKPILLRYGVEEGFIRLEVKDCGAGLGSYAIPAEIADDDILKDNGRGLFLIKALADEVKFSKSTIVIKMLHQPKKIAI